MNRQLLKRESKTLLHQHYSFFFILFIPIFLLTLFTGVMNLPWWNNPTDVWNSTDTGSLLLNLLLSLVSVGVNFVLIDLFRDQATATQPLKKSMTIFTNAHYVLGVIVIGIIQFIFIVLWMILLIIPGIVKSIAYSQAYYIYRDALDHGHGISYLDAITQSRYLMNGHKMDYFILSLSFIGWMLLVIITCGIALLYVQPYFSLTFANFYCTLRDQGAQPSHA